MNQVLFLHPCVFLSVQWFLIGIFPPGLGQSGITHNTMMRVPQELKVRTLQKEFPESLSKLHCIDPTVLDACLSAL